MKYLPIQLIPTLLILILKLFKYRSKILNNFNDTGIYANMHILHFISRDSKSSYINEEPFDFQIKFCLQ